MTKSAAAVSQVPADRYTPWVPGPSTPLFVLRESVALPEGVPVPVLRDEIWPVHHLSKAEHQRVQNLNFATLPPALRDVARVHFFNMINTPAQGRTRGSASLPSAGTLVAHFARFKHLAKWMDSEGNGKKRIPSLNKMTTKLWEDYVHHVKSETWTYENKVLTLGTVLSLMAHNWDLPWKYTIARPPWWAAGTTGYREWLGPKPKTGDNKTLPFSAEAISSLISASLTTIDRYLEGDLTFTNRPTSAEVRAWWRQERGIEIPMRSGRGGASPVLAKEYLEPYKRATGWVTPLQKWDVIASAFAVIAYFTGMRATEVLNLKRGCVTYTPAEEHATRAVEYRITGLHFKAVRDENGDQISEGEMRDQPWVTIEPAARAVKALERLTDGDMLFEVRKKRSDRTRTGDINTSADVAIMLAKMTRRWNDFAAKTGEREILTGGSRGILGDNKTYVATARFRRTLAHHIANIPGGEIALGIQYGHVKSVVSQGYAGQSESGFEDEVEMEAIAVSMRDMDRVSKEYEAGSVFSGPGMARAVEAIKTYEARFEGKTMTEAQLRRYRDSDLTSIYENPDGPYLCAWRAETALCNIRKDAKMPDLTKPHAECPNVVLLDRHIDIKLAERDELAAALPHMPKPWADRAKEDIAALDHQIERHKKAGRVA